MFAYSTAARASQVGRDDAERPATEAVPILERLERMSISANRVTDECSVPGEVTVELDADVWRPATAPGYFKLFIADRGNEGTIAIVLTRFIVDHLVDVASLLDHACVETRSLPDWVEQEMTRTSAGYRTEGTSLQTGTYIGDEQTWFCAMRYAAYRRGNVAYLLHAAGTAPAREGAEFRGAIARAVGTVALDD